MKTSFIKNLWLKKSVRRICEEKMWQNHPVQVIVIPANVNDCANRVQVTGIEFKLFREKES